MEWRALFSRSWPYTAFVIITLLVLLPALRSPPMLYQSFWIDIVWADQFNDALRSADLYPRWLPRSHDGLGSPVFYYYPPLAFYLSGLFGLLGLAAYPSVIAAFGAAMLASGVTMFRWLKGTPQAFAGAAIFMIAPYHIYDFYFRGALAEYCAIALLPLVALGLKRAAKNQIALAALAYGALIATHLPLAILASLFLIVPYGAWLVFHDWKAALPISMALATGIALSCFYLVPALALDAYRDTAKLWALPVLQPEAWNLFQPSQWVESRSLPKILFMTFSIGLCSAVIAIWQRSAWAALAAAVSLLTAGAIPGLWSIPLLSAVQFPWRGLAIAEFALATSIAMVPRRAAIGLAILLPLYILSATFARPVELPLTLTADFLHSKHQDVPEYLPPGIPWEDKWHSQWALDLAAVTPGPLVHSGRTVERTFYFPAWQVSCQGREVETAPDHATKLLSYRGVDCEKRLVWTWPEWIGFLLSLIALIIIVMTRCRTCRAY